MLPSAGTTGWAAVVGCVSVKPPVVSVSDSVVAAGELIPNASVVATLVGSAAAASSGGGVGGRMTSPLVVLALLVEFKTNSVAAFAALRNRIVRASDQDSR